jgi:hypothetical protein
MWLYVVPILSQSNPVQPSHPVSLRFIPVSSFYLPLLLRRCVLPSNLPTKKNFSPTRITCTICLIVTYLSILTTLWPIPVACGLRRRSTTARLLGLRFRIRTEFGCLFLVSVVCCLVESCEDRSLFQRDPTERGASASDLEFSAIRRPRSRRECYSMKKMYEILLGQIEVRTRLLSFGA